MAGVGHSARALRALSIGLVLLLLPLFSWAGEGERKAFDSSSTQGTSSDTGAHADVTSRQRDFSDALPHFNLASVNVTRLLYRIDDLASFERKSNGFSDWDSVNITAGDPIPVTRVAYSAQDIISRRRIKKWMKEAGLEVQTDYVGNMFGLWRGRRDPKSKRKKKKKKREKEEEANESPVASPSSTDSGNTARDGDDDDNDDAVPPQGDDDDVEKDGSLLSLSEEEEQKLRERQAMIERGDRHLLEDMTSPANTTSATPISGDDYVPEITEVIATGSHIDSIRGAGRYDGVLGVLGALEAIHALRDSGFEPERSIEVILFAHTESVRFGPGTANLGSRMMAGKADVESLEDAMDVYGYNILQAVHGAGYGDKKNGTLVAINENVRLRAKGRYGAFIELHVETGKMLQDREMDLGDVREAYKEKQRLMKETEKENEERANRKAEEAERKREAREKELLESGQLVLVEQVQPEEENQLENVNTETETRDGMFDGMLPELRDQAIQSNAFFKKSYSAVKESSPSALYKINRHLKKMDDPKYRNIAAGNIGIVTAAAGTKVVEYSFHSSAETGEVIGGGSSEPGHIEMKDRKDSAFIVARVIEFMREAVLWENTRALKEFDEPGKTTANIGKIVWFEKDIHHSWNRRPLLATVYLEVSDVLEEARDRVWRSIKRSIAYGLFGRHLKTEKGWWKNDKWKNYPYSLTSRSFHADITEDPIFHADQTLIDKVKRAVSVINRDKGDRKGLTPYEVPEYAQHDVNFMNILAPSTMLLLPVSYDYDNRYANNIPEIGIREHHLELGVKALAHSLRALSIEGIERDVRQEEEEAEELDEYGEKITTVTTGVFGYTRTRKLDSKGRPVREAKNFVYYDEVSEMSGKPMAKIKRDMDSRTEQQRANFDKRQDKRKTERDGRNI